MQKRCSCVLGQPSRGQQSFSLEERKPTKQLGDSSWVTTNRWQPNSRVSKTLSGGRPGRGCSQQVAVFLAAAAGCQDLAMGQRPAFASDARLAIGQSSSCHSNWNLSASAFSLLPLNDSLCSGFVAPLTVSAPFHGLASLAHLLVDSASRR
jgi:hypothetical protein